MIDLASILDMVKNLLKLWLEKHNVGLVGMKFIVQIHHKQRIIKQSYESVIYVRTVREIQEPKFPKKKLWKARKMNKNNPYKLRERERVWPMVVESSDAMVGWQRVGFPPWVFEALLLDLNWCSVGEV